MSIRQFLIERECPNGTAPEGFEHGDWSHVLPICVWIDLGNQKALKCGTGYRLLDHLPCVNEGGREFTVNAPDGYSPFVCEHMGRLIE